MILEGYYLTVMVGIKRKKHRKYLFKNAFVFLPEKSLKDEFVEALREIAYNGIIVRDYADIAVMPEVYLYKDDYTVEAIVDAVSGEEFEIYYAGLNLGIFVMYAVKEFLRKNGLFGSDIDKKLLVEIEVRPLHMPRPCLAYFNVDPKKALVLPFEDTEANYFQDIFDMFSKRIRAVYPSVGEQCIAVGDDFVIECEYGKPKKIYAVLGKVPVIIDDDMVEIYQRKDFKEDFLQSLEIVLNHLPIFTRDEFIAVFR